MDKMKVLAVDDRTEDLEVIKEILELSGFEVIALQSGSKALNILPDKFDAVLLDIQMPLSSGYELIKKVRVKTRNRIPVLFVSIIPKQEANLEGSDDYIEKPFSPKELVNAVNKAILKYKRIDKPVGG